jgi:hypothetical protein
VFYGAFPPVLIAGVIARASTAGSRRALFVALVAIGQLVALGVISHGDTLPSFSRAHSSSARHTHALAAHPRHRRLAIGSQPCGGRQLARYRRRDRTSSA